MEVADLLSEFESLGDNCEFGFVQRAANAKGRGLFQWGGMPLAHLIPALYERFRDLDDPSHFKIAHHGEEYVIHIPRCGFRIHTASYKSQQAEEKVATEVAARIRYLAHKLIEDLEEGSKTFIFRQNEPLDPGMLLELRNAVASYGPNTLLWVAEEPDIPEGTITWLGDGLMKGSINRLSVRSAVGATPFAGWHRVLYNAYAERSFGGDPVHLAKTQSMHTIGEMIAKLSFLSHPPADVTFASGWGLAEQHQTWSGPDSRLILNMTLPQTNLLVRIEGAAFDDKRGRGPRMIISANGQQVKKFRLIPNCPFQCVVPKSCLRPAQPLELRFQFPDAGTPASVRIGSDTRNLGYAFRSLVINELV